MTPNPNKCNVILYPFLNLLIHTILYIIQMQLRYAGNLVQPVDGMQKISSIAWSSNGKKMAVAFADRTVQLFDDTGAKKDKFPTKPSEKGQKSYTIRAVDFDPDGEKIAVAQSDNIVFVYKIGKEWGDRKAIVNKFPVSSSVTCMVWPKNRPNEIVFGLAEGKVRMGVLKMNKSNVIYSTDNYVVSMSASKDGNIIVTGHIDCSIMAYNLDTQHSKKLCTHQSIPYALAYGESIITGGSDQKVAFYDPQGNLLERKDYSKDDKVRDFTVAAFNPSGETAVIGNFNRFYIYNYNNKKGQWDEISCQNIKNYYTVTAVCWKNDGAKLAIGNLCGSLDMFDASLKKVNYKGKFEFNFVSPSQVVILSLATGKKSILRSVGGYEITKVNIYLDKYAVGNTMESLVIGDLENDKSSEIMWRGAGSEKFDFTNPNICLIFNVGELTLVEYGKNEPLGTCRTEQMKSNLISARVSEKGTKVIAYLLDLQTIAVNDLQNSTTLCQITHDSKIDYLELNANANKLLFKDKRKQLYLYDLTNMTKITLLAYCTFAKWVPESEVVVAQNRTNLNVWYSIDNPDKVTIYPIKGDVDSIERANGKTEVIVSEGNNTTSYSLDESLIEFGFAIEAKDLEKAASILDSSDMTNETEANWKTLAKIALECQNISVAQHCYAALGDIAKANYLRQVLKIVDKYEKETGKSDGISFYKVQAKLAVLDKQFHKAESILLENGEDEEAMDMYQQLHKWGETIDIAERKRHPDVAELKARYFEWLIDTKQEEKAAEVKESEENYNEAIELYLKGGLPARAANVVYSYSVSFSQDLLEKIANSLYQAGMYEKAGEFYEEMQNLQKALDCYCKGNAYRKAVDLARVAEERLVVSLEERWGNYLVSIKQTESAINHYIEAGAIQKAIQAAISSREWNKAIQLLAHQPPEVARPFYKQIAKYYGNVRQYDFAEKYYLKAAQPIEAFEMYTKANKWDQAYRVAKEYLPENEIVALYVKQAQKFEGEEKWKQAEKMYLVVEESDMAINMYKKCGQYDNMIRLVSKHRPNLLKETHLSVAQKLQKEGNFKAAEQHYIDAGAWRGAVEMYKSHNNWEEAVRCSKLYGTDVDTCELAKRWAETLSPEVGMKMLLKMNLVDAVIEYLSDRNEFDEAFKMANANAKHKIRDVHLKYAFKLEDEKRYKEAQDHFIKAGKAPEAINMYEHVGDFHSALQVARQYDPQSVSSILLNQAKMFVEKRDYAKAETAFINAGKPELAIKMYMDTGSISEAEKVCKKHAPHLLEEVMRNYSKATGGSLSPQQRIQQAQTYDDNRNYTKAIEGYMSIGPDDLQNAEQLEQIWKRAVQLAMTHEKDKALKIINTVIDNLYAVGKFEATGELLQQIGQYEEACKVYCDGKLWDNAKNCANMIKAKDVNNKVMSMIMEKERATYKNNKDPWTCLKSGDYNAACEIFAETGDWKNCLEKAHEKGPELLNKFQTEYLKICLQGGKFQEAIQTYARYGMPLIPKNYQTYKQLAVEIFLECDAKEVVPLRQALFEFVKLLEGTNEPGSPTLQEFTKFNLIAHLVNLKFVYEKKKDCLPLYTKVTISLLRYCEFIRLDKLYYEAGIACKNTNQLGMASIFLNRYLDLNEIIDDPENGNLPDNNDFDITDIPSPYDVNMPVNNFISKDEKEKIKDYLLQININQKVDSVLPTRHCDKCNANMFEGSLVCFKCKHKHDVCIVTGYPVSSVNGRKCKSCGKWGDKEAWALYLQNFASCPWCNNPPN